MHDGSFLGLQGVHRAEITGIGPDGAIAETSQPSCNSTKIVAAVVPRHRRPYAVAEHGEDRP